MKRSEMPPEIAYNTLEAARCRRRITRRAAFQAYLSRRGRFPRAPRPAAEGQATFGEELWRSFC